MQAINTAAIFRATVAENEVRIHVTNEGTYNVSGKQSKHVGE